MMKLSERQKLINVLPYHLLMWLCSQNLLGLFVSYAVKDGFLLTKLDIIEKAKKTRNMEKFIFHTAFPWLNTEEGEAFWFRRKWDLENYLKHVK